MPEVACKSCHGIIRASTKKEEIGRFIGIVATCRAAAVFFAQVILEEL
jgi:hypothetical protein